MKPLIDLFNEYCVCLAGKTFNIDFDGKHDSIAISFDEINFPHLTGIKYCVPPEHKTMADGGKGVENIKNGTITLEKCEEHNAKMYNKFMLRKIDALEQFLIPVAKKGLFTFECCFFNPSRVIGLYKHISFEKCDFIIRFRQKKTTYAFLFGFFGAKNTDVRPVSFRRCDERIADFLDLQDFIKGSVNFG